MIQDYSLLRSAISQDSLLGELRAQFEKMEDKRHHNCQYKLPSVLMSGVAMFSLKHRSLLSFETQTEASRANLRNLFGVEELMSDAGFRKCLDPVEWQPLRDIFPEYYSRLKKLGIVKEYHYLGGYNLVSLDGVEHFQSCHVSCAHCLDRQLKSGETQYHHNFLAAVMVHPAHREVFILGGEPMIRADGQTKNDCENAAAKRLIPYLAQAYWRERFLYLGDAIYATAPIIRLIQAHQADFLLSVKPDSHRSLWKSFEARRANQALIHSHTVEEYGERYEFHYFNHTTLNEANPEVKVNFLFCQVTDRQNKQTTFSWVTSRLISRRNLMDLMRAGRSRWKIENETFNTLKNQAYHFEHNYGHGKQNLATNLVYLMLFAFHIDQIVQKCSKTFQVVLGVCRSKIKLWEFVRVLFYVEKFNTMNEIYVHIASLFKVKLA
jgi:hypothetical protein